MGLDKMRESVKERQRARETVHARKDGAGQAVLSLSRKRAVAATGQATKKARIDEDGEPVDATFGGLGIPGEVN
jgi:hypothetical protein